MVTSLIDSRSREEKRISRRLAQRAATLALLSASPEKDLSFESDDVAPRSTVMRVPYGRAAQIKLPVLAPSVSVDDGPGGGSWLVVADDVGPVMHRRS